MDELTYRARALRVQPFLERRVRDGAEYVTYGEVMAHLGGIDRFTCSFTLGALVELNTENDEPLWSSLVSFKDTRRRNGVVFQRRGYPGGSFYTAAEYYGHAVGNRERFMRAQRAACRERLGLKASALG